MQKGGLVPPNLDATGGQPLGKDLIRTDEISDLVRAAWYDRMVVVC